MDLQSILNSLGHIKLAEYGEMYHPMLPGRTSVAVSRGGKGPTMRPEEVIAKLKTTPKPKAEGKGTKPQEEDEENMSSKKPKIDISVSIKLASSEPPTIFSVLRKMGEIGHQQNTGAYPPLVSDNAGSATGGLDSQFLPEAGNLLRTPMVQGGSDGISQDDIIGEVAKVSAHRRQYAPGEMPMMAIDEDTPEANAFNDISSQYAQYAPPPSPLVDDNAGETVGTAGGGLLGAGAGYGASKLLRMKGPAALLPVLGGMGLGAVTGAGAGAKFERGLVSKKNQAEQEAYREELLQHLRERMQLR